MRPALRHLLLPIVLIAGLAHADLVVVTSPKSGLERISRQDLVNVYMGRLRTHSTGEPAVALDLAAQSAERVDFYRQLVNKESADIKAYWSRLIFSGGARPPQTVNDPETLIRLLNQMPGAVGYLDRKQVDHRVRIVYEFTPMP